MTRDIRNSVAKCVSLGPLPASDTADETQVLRLTEALLEILPPVSEDEAVLLASMFGKDECFGLAWTLVHLIESAVNGAPVDRFPATIRDNEWIKLLENRAARSK